MQCVKKSLLSVNVGFSEKQGLNVPLKYSYNLNVSNLLW